MIFVFYILGVICLVVIRPWFMDKKNADFNAGIASLYAGLYLYPILAVMHAICCGLICEFTLNVVLRSVNTYLNFMEFNFLCRLFVPVPRYNRFGDLKCCAFRLKIRSSEEKFSNS